MRGVCDVDVLASVFVKKKQSRNRWMEEVAICKKKKG
jgi:hypothetical protein